MNTDAVPSTHRQVNWVPMPDPVTESEVNIDLKWTADSRTQLAIQRQTKLMGFDSADDYLRQIIATTIASNEADTINTPAAAASTGQSIRIAGSGGASVFENRRLSLRPASLTVSLVQSRNGGAM